MNTVTCTGHNMNTITCTGHNMNTITCTGIVEVQNTHQPFVTVYARTQWVNPAQLAEPKCLTPTSLMETLVDDADGAGQLATKDGNLLFCIVFIRVLNFFSEPTWFKIGRARLFPPIP